MDVDAVIVADHCPLPVAAGCMPGHGVLGPGAVVWDADPSFAGLFGCDPGGLGPGALDELVNPQDLRSLVAHLGGEPPDDPLSIRGVGGHGRPLAIELWLVGRSDAGGVIALAAPQPCRDDDLPHALSHDLRGRIRVVSSCLELVADHIGPAGDQRLDSLLARGRRAGETASRMVAGLVDHLRQQDFDALEPVSLDTVLDAATSEVGVGVAVEAPSPCGAVLADRNALTEAVGEILENARRFAPSAETGHPAVVEVQVRDRGPWVEVRMEDRGPGFASDSPEDAFGLFRQFQGRDWSKGLGLGLVTARRLIEAQGGRVRASNGADGAVVTVTLARPRQG